MTGKLRKLVNLIRREEGRDEKGQGSRRTLHAAPATRIIVRGACVQITPPKYIIVFEATVNEIISFSDIFFLVNRNATAS